MAKSYDEQKEWRGRSYTGMKVGRGHKWDYEGEWVERKLGPDLWDVSFNATKSRKGRGAPEHSGAPVGTEYLWFFAPTLQRARKLDANTYQTHLEGLKWKVGFRPATAQTWDYEWAKTGETARQRMIRVLEQTLADLKADERAETPLEIPAIEGERPVPPKRPRKAPAKKAAAKKKAPAKRKAPAQKKLPPAAAPSRAAAEASEEEAGEEA